MEDIFVLKITETHLDFDSVVNFEKILYDHINQGYKAILMDFQNVEMVDSRAIGLFIAYKIFCDKKNVIIGFINMCKDVEYIFKVTKINTVLNIYKTHNEAVEGVKKLIS